MKDHRDDRSGLKPRFSISIQADAGKIGFPPDLAWQPPTDVSETEAEIVVVCEIAGMENDAIAVVTDGARLRISGVRRSFAGQGKRQFHQLEIPVGTFSRVIELSAPVDEARTTARYERGLLEVRLAKKAPGGPARRVEIE